MCLQLTYGRTLSPTAVSSSGYFAGLVQEFIWGKTGSENSLPKSKAWKCQLSPAHTLQMCTDVTITPRGIAFRGNDLDRTERICVVSAF